MWDGPRHRHNETHGCVGGWRSDLRLPVGRALVDRDIVTDLPLSAEDAADAVTGRGVVDMKKTLVKSPTAEINVEKTKEETRKSK